MKTTKTNEIEYILQKALSEPYQQPEEHNRSSQRTHLMRCIFIAIDMTDSMHIRDLKPTRLAVSVEMIRRFVRGVDVF